MLCRPCGRGTVDASSSMQVRWWCDTNSNGELFPLENRQNHGLDAEDSKTRLGSGCPSARPRSTRPFWLSTLVLVLSRVATVLVIVIGTSADDCAIFRPRTTRCLSSIDRLRCSVSRGVTIARRASSTRSRSMALCCPTGRRNGGLNRHHAIGADEAARSHCHHPQWSNRPPQTPLSTGAA